MNVDLVEARLYASLLFEGRTRIESRLLYIDPSGRPIRLQTVGLNLQKEESGGKGGFRLDGASKDVGMESAWTAEFGGHSDEMMAF
jgi:hypothetical protein